MLNNSVPNAWVIPIGRIAFNRRLLYELNSDSELATVMDHKMVYSAARHGAKSMECGLLMQGTIIAVGIDTQNTLSKIGIGGD